MNAMVTRWTNGMWLMVYLAIFSFHDKGSLLVSGASDKLAALSRQRRAKMMRGGDKAMYRYSPVISGPYNSIFGAGRRSPSSKSWRSDPGTLYYGAKSSSHAASSRSTSFSRMESFSWMSAKTSMSSSGKGFRSKRSGGKGSSSTTGSRRKSSSSSMSGKGKGYNKGKGYYMGKGYHRGKPSTSSPSHFPTMSPTYSPTVEVAVRDTMNPTATPSSFPTPRPSTKTPTVSPSGSPSEKPTPRQSDQPSASPSAQPTLGESNHPSVSTTDPPSHRPTVAPSNGPTASPSSLPSQSPSMPRQGYAVLFGDVTYSQGTNGLTNDCTNSNNRALWNELVDYDTGSDGTTVVLYDISRSQFQASQSSFDFASYATLKSADFVSTPVIRDSGTLDTPNLLDDVKTLVIPAPSEATYSTSEIAILAEFILDRAGRVVFVVDTSTVSSDAQNEANRILEALGSTMSYTTDVSESGNLAGSVVISSISETEGEYCVADGVRIETGDLDEEIASYDSGGVAVAAGPINPPRLQCAVACFDVKQPSVGFSTTIRSFFTDETIVDFYGYDDNQDSYRGNDLISQISQESSVFVHQNEESCDVSIGFLHDEEDDGDGGDVIFVISGDFAEPAVQDDPYDSYSYDPATNTTTLDWSWLSCCTDGGAITVDLNDGECLDIEPNFLNGIETWNAITGPLLSATYIELNMTEPLQICKRTSCP